MQAHVTIEPIYKVTPRGFWLEKKEYITPFELIKKLSLYQSQGSYDLQLEKCKDTIAVVNLKSHNDYKFCKFLGEFILSTKNMFTVTLEVF